MRKFLVLVKMALLETLAYRGDIFMYVISGMIGPIVMLSVWLAVYASGGKPPLAYQNMINYYIYLFVIEMWNSAWSSPFLSADIRYGRLTPSLVKPMSHLIKYAGQNIGEKFFKTLYLFPVILILGFLLKAQVPALTPIYWVVFIISWIFSAALTFLLDWIIGLSSFWLDESSAITEFYDVFYFVFSGKMIPLVALPILFQQWGIWFPFRYTLSLPIEILTNQITNQELLTSLGVQAGWLLLAALGVKIVWAKGLKKYSSVGA